MIRTDVCPNCKTMLRWEPPDEMVPGKWICPKCKYKRGEGSMVTPWFRKRVRKTLA